MSRLRGLCVASIGVLACLTSGTCCCTNDRVLATHTPAYVLVEPTVDGWHESKTAIDAVESKLASMLDAIAWVESRNNDAAVGDDGRSIGRYQIGRDAWYDACDYDRSLRTRDGRPAEWSDVFDPVYARSVVKAYLRRYGRDAWLKADVETLARIHNGGPRGANKRATKAYAQRVVARMQSVVARLER